MEPVLQSRIAELAGAGVREATPVSGGDVARAYRVELVDGRRIFAKTHPAPPAGFFGTEAAGLAWLAAAGALPVPGVVAVRDDPPACLLLEWIEVGGAATPAREAAFGRALAELHRTGAPGFGRADGRTTGSLALPNEPCETWAGFYRDRRILPLAAIAADRQALGAGIIRRLDSLADRLHEFGAADEPPARLHGDLWAGNRVIDRSGRSWLIDPAAHGGHREFDLAMMRLFGGFGADCHAGYQDAWPLAAGWEARVDLHQLAPLIVHAVKFGGGYAGAVETALDRLGV